MKTGLAGFNAQMGRVIRQELCDHRDRVSEHLKVNYRFFLIEDILRLMNEGRLPKAAFDYLADRFRASAGHGKNSDAASAALMELITPREMQHHITGLPRGRRQRVVEAVPLAEGMQARSKGL